MQIPTKIPTRGLLIFLALLFAVWAGAASVRADEGQPLVDEPLAERRARLAEMPPAEAEELRQKKERFDQLDAQQQQQLRSLQAALVDHGQGSRLENIAERYAQWLKTLSPGQRAELLALPPAERLALIRQFKEDQQAQRIRELVRAHLKPEDVRAILTWLGRYAEAHEAELVALLDSQTQQYVRQITEPTRRRLALFRAVQQHGSDQSLPMPTGAELQQLRDQLSDEARAALDKIADNDQQLGLVLQWMRTAMMTRMMPPQVDRDELERFFAKDLDRAQRDYLEALPREQLEQELRRLYWLHKMRGREGDRPAFFRHPDGHPPGFRGGGPGRGSGPRSGFGPGPPRGERDRPRHEGPEGL